MALLPTSNPANRSNDGMHEIQSNTSVPCHYEDPQIFTVIPVYILCISVLGILFNAFVLMVLCLHRKASTVAEIYLGNLAFADLLLVSFLPFWAYNVSEGFKWPFNDALCKLLGASITINAYSSIYFVVLISGDRYLALAHPLSHKIIRRPCYAKLGCLMVWLLVLLLSSPAMIYRTAEEHHSKNFSICLFNIPHVVPHDISMTILTFIIPIVLITFFTIKVLKVLSNRQKGAIKLNGQRSEQKATTLILVVVLAFVVCWVPYHTIKMLHLLHKVVFLRGCRFTFNLGLCTLIFSNFAYFNSVLNPILYVIVGKNFQRKVKDLFTKRGNNENTTTVSLLSARTNVSTTVQTEDSAT